MHALTILDRARAAGLRLTATDRGTILIEPKHHITDELRGEILAHKRELLGLLEFERLLAEMATAYQLPHEEVAEVRAAALRDLDAATRCFQAIARTRGIVE
jgi:hypothetical protein